MGSCTSDSDSRVSTWSHTFIPEGSETLEFAEKNYPEPKTLEFADSKTNPEAKTLEFTESTTNSVEKILECVYENDPDAETLVYGFKQEEPWTEMKKKKKKQVFLEGYVEAGDEDDLTRTKSLTDEDLDELKGCLDLGFGFSYEEIPELCNTLPALELCYSMSQKFLDEQQKSPETPPATATATDTCSSLSSPIANWRISSPGDHPEEVKARLKFWAQAVACTVRLCS